MRPLMTGVLYPSDGVEGCSFMVTPVKDKFHVLLLSPYGDKTEVVDEATCTLSELGPWLENHADY